MSSAINTKMAIMEMKEGSMEQATAFINRAVEDYVFDKQVALSEFDTWKEENETILNDLKEEERNAINEAYNSKYNELVTTKEEKQKVGEYMIAYNQYGAGISLDDDVFTAQKKASRVAAATRARESAGGGFTDQEMRRLEQAGLSNAPRQEKLDYLYGGKDDTGDFEYAGSVLDQNIAAGNTSPNQMAQIYAGLKEETDLTDSDIKAKMVAKGMQYDSLTGWNYTGTTLFTSDSEQEEESGSILDTIRETEGPVKQIGRALWEKLKSAIWE